MTAVQRFQEAMPKNPKDPKAKGCLAKGRQILQVGFSHGKSSKSIDTMINK